MIGHAILFIVLPLAVAWLAGASAYFPPYPAPKTDPESEPQFEAEVRMFLAEWITKTSSDAWPVTNSTGTRESMQLRTAA